MKNYIVGIDAGHGGEDRGGSAVGVPEKDRNLAVAMALYKRAIKHGLYTPIMTRTTDTALTIRRRADIFNAGKVKLGVSIHHNAVNGKVAGYEIIHSINYGQGQMLAKEIAKGFLKIGQHASPRGIFTRTQANGRDWYGMISMTVAPVVITEFAYIDNPVDSGKMDQQEEYEKQAMAIDAAIIATLMQIEAKDATPHIADGAFGFLLANGLDPDTVKDFDRFLSRGDFFMMIAELLGYRP